MDSILDTIKKMLGIIPADTAFDFDIIAHVNSAFMSLNQLGIGPINTFAISDNAGTWSDFLGSDLTMYSAVKSYIYLKVRQIFDPPTSSFVVDSMDRQIAEFEYRLRTQKETKPYFLSANNIVTGIPVLGSPILGIV